MNAVPKHAGLDGFNKVFNKNSIFIGFILILYENWPRTSESYISVMAIIFTCYSIILVPNLVLSSYTKWV